MVLGEKLLKLRKSQGLSQEDLASRLDVSRQAVSRWELGAALPDTPNLLQISRLFGVTTDYLLHDDDNGEDIPAIKLDRLKTEHNRKIALIVLVGLHSLCLFLGVVGIIFQLWFIVPMAIANHIVNIIVFEIAFRKHGGFEQAENYRRKYYRISVWFFAYLPLYMIMMQVWALYPRPYSSIIFEISIFIVYLIVCCITTAILRKK